MKGTEPEWRYTAGLFNSIYKAILIFAHRYYYTGSTDLLYSPLK